MLPAELAVETQGAGQQPMEQVHILLFPSMEQAGTAGMGSAQQPSIVSFLKTGRTWAMVRVETGASTKSPTTKRPSRKRPSRNLPPTKRPRLQNALTLLYNNFFSKSHIGLNIWKLYF
jgi:hypothetical protein